MSIYLGQHLLSGAEVNNLETEGTWTVGHSGSALATAVGRYTKIGNLVHLDFELTTNHNDSANAGALTITGLPFRFHSTGTSNASALGLFTSRGHVTNAMIGRMDNNATEIDLEFANNGQLVTIGYLYNGNSTSITGNITYITDQT